MPELAHQGIFQLSRPSVNCHVKTVEEYPPFLNRKDFMQVPSVSQDHGGSHKNLMEIFFEKLSLYDVKLFKDKKKYYFGPNFGRLFSTKIK